MDHKWGDQIELSFFIGYADVFGSVFLLLAWVLETVEFKDSFFLFDFEGKRSITAADLDTLPPEGFGLALDACGGFIAEEFWGFIYSFLRLCSVFGLLSLSAFYEPVFSPLSPQSFQIKIIRAMITKSWKKYI